MKTLQGLKSISITEQGTSTWELKTTNDFLKFRHASLSIVMTVDIRGEESLYLTAWRKILSGYTRIMFYSLYDN